MANALDQAVETAAAQKDVPLPQEGEGSVSVSDNQRDTPPDTPSNPPNGTQAGTTASAPPASNGAKGTNGAESPPAPEGKTESKAPASKPKGKSTGIPEADRNAPQPALDPAQFPPVELNGRYLIYPSMALPDLNSPQAMAYAVEDRRESGRQLFALICKPGLPVRTSLMRELKAQNINGMIPMADFGPVFWGPIDQTAVAIVFERPLGGRFLDTFGDRPPRVSEYELAKLLIEPVAHAISELQAIDFAHRAIRLDHLFFMDKERRELVVGECLSSPPGFDQPIIYEPLNRAYAMPSGRGYGMSYDDMYALGIMTVFALLGVNPVARLSDEEMLAAKAEFGSYQCMCGNERIPMTLIEPLRGLLSDEEFERWNMEALDHWLNGQKKTPIQRRPATKPKTPFKFGGRDHMTTRSIAHAFSKNVPEAVKIIKNGKLDQWVSSSLGETALADSIVGVIANCKVNEGSPDGADDVLVSKVCIRLDPHAPIRYKNFSFLTDGFGAALAVEYLRKGNFQIPGEILARDLISFWVAAQSARTPDITSQERTFQTLRGFAKINEMGYGMERCLYELNRSLPCQSDLLRTTYVDHIDDFITALDQVADHVDTRSRPMDKHIAAFIATHFKYDIAPHLKALSDKKEETSLIGLLSLYALMQWRMKIPTLYGLSSWLGGLLAPAIGTYHSRTTRRRIEQEIPALVRQGSLPELFDLIDNAERRHVDTTEFDEAQVAFAHAEAEIESIVGEGVDQNKAALQVGERVTATISIILSMIATAVIIFVQTM
ncbi:hypothetical protein [Magnetovibrio sp.]|uniref:hypothetical protein n=1 Tax=Magnetovibrio sp. TaxID=2024836 RepID=UPI002F91D86A